MTECSTKTSFPSTPDNPQTCTYPLNNISEPPYPLDFSLHDTAAWHPSFLWRSLVFRLLYIFGTFIHFYAFLALPSKLPIFPFVSCCSVSATLILFLSNYWIGYLPSPLLPALLPSLYPLWPILILIIPLPLSSPFSFFLFLFPCPSLLSPGYASFPSTRPAGRSNEFLSSSLRCLIQ